MRLIAGGYRAVFKKFMAWIVKSGGILNVNQFDAAFLDRYAKYLEKLGRAPKTQSNHLTTLKQWISWLIEAGHLVGCAPIKLKVIKVESQRAYCYRPVEVKAILEHCRKDTELRWLADVVTALACSGVRIGELLDLKWSDIDFDTQLITLAEESGHRVTGQARRTLKSSRSRSLPIHPDLLLVLQRLAKTSGYVFPGPSGGRLQASEVRNTLLERVLKPLVKEFPANGGGQSFIEGRPHSFRHYFISMCANKGVPERVVMEWVGHADSAIVRHYYHLHDEESRRQMHSLDLVGNGVAGCSSGKKSEVPN